MQDFSKRQGNSLMRFLLSVVGVIILGSIAFLVLRGVYNIYGKFSLAADSQREAHERLELLKSQEKQIGAAVESFESPRGLEAEIRERYGVAREGEGRIDIVRDAPSSSPQVVSDESIFVRLFQTLWPF